MLCILHDLFYALFLEKNVGWKSKSNLHSLFLVSLFPNSVTMDVSVAVSHSSAEFAYTTCLLLFPHDSSTRSFNHNRVHASLHSDIPHRRDGNELIKEGRSEVSPRWIIVTCDSIMELWSTLRPVAARSGSTQARYHIPLTLKIEF